MPPTTGSHCSTVRPFTGARANPVPSATVTKARSIACDGGKHAEEDDRQGAAAADRERLSEAEAADDAATLDRSEAVHAFLPFIGHHGSRSVAWPTGPG